MPATRRAGGRIRGGSARRGRISAARYQIRGLPAGEYLAVAVSYVEDGMWNDPEYLESLRRYAVKLTLNEGDAQSPLLKLVAP